LLTAVNTTQNPFVRHTRLALVGWKGKENTIPDTNSSLDLICRRRICIDPYYLPAYLPASQPAYLLPVLLSYVLRMLAAV
jgi:hypothetical protein